MCLVERDWLRSLNERISSKVFEETFESFPSNVVKRAYKGAMGVSLVMSSSRN